MCFQKIREGVEKVMSSWGGVLLKMMVGWQRWRKKSKLGGSRSHIFKYDTKLQK